MIPKRIHQTYKTETIPPHYNPKWIDSWKDHHPEWDYNLWTDYHLLEAAETLGFDQVLLALQSAPGVVRADIGRYLVLYVCGGLYVDLDYECFRPMDPLMNASGVVSRENPTTWAIGNAWLAFPERHPLMELAMRTAAQKWLSGTRPVGAATGPYMLTDLIWHPKNGPWDLTILSSDVVCPVHWEGSGGRAVAQGNLSPKDIEGLREKLTAQGSYAATYWCHGWEDVLR